jgi:hypothetical protein
MKYTFNLTIEAESEKEAQEKMDSAAILLKKLKTREIKKLAEVVVLDPVKTAFAKKALGL